MDLYPEVAVEAGFIKPNSLKTKLLTKMARFGLRKADSVIVIGRAMKERVIGYGLLKEKVNFIPNWVNQIEIEPVSQLENQLRKRMG